MHCSPSTTLARQTCAYQRDRPAFSHNTANLQAFSPLLAILLPSGVPPDLAYYPCNIYCYQLIRLPVNGLTCRPGSSPLRDPKKKTHFALPGLEAYGWEAHDGEAFGRQELTDGRLRLTTSLAKRFCRGCVGGDWAVRLAARALAPGSIPQGGGNGAGPLRPPQQASFVFYIADENVRLPVRM